MLKTVSTQLALASDTLPEVLAKGNTTGGTDLAVSLGDDIKFANSSKATFGASDNLSIYYDGSNSYIKENGTGQLIVNATNLYLRNSDNSQDYLTAVEGGATKLLYSDIVKLATTSTGIAVTGGVLLGGTAAANLLDDYEEGEWSPVVRDDPSAGNSGGGTIKGFYTKIGRNVFINFSVSNLDTTGMTPGNDLFVTGLPFTPATVTGTNYYTGALVMHSVTTAGNQAAAIQDATDYIKLYETVSGAAFEFITVGDISSGVSDIRFSLTYEAA